MVSGSRELGVRVERTFLGRVIELGTGGASRSSPSAAWTGVGCA
jgi:hypothetical protein